MKACTQCGYQMEDYEVKCPKCGTLQATQARFVAPPSQNTPYHSTAPDPNDDPVLTAMNRVGKNASLPTSGISGSSVLAGAALLFIGLPLACNYLTSHEAGDAEAYTVAKAEIRSRLKAPATADFPDLTEGGVHIDHVGERYTVSAYVDAQNSFGAKLRENWTAQLHRSQDKQSMVLERAQMDEDKQAAPSLPTE